MSIWSGIFAGQYDHSLLTASSGNGGKFDVIVSLPLAYRFDCLFAAVINIILIALVVQLIQETIEGDYEKGDAKSFNLYPILCWDCSVYPSYLVGMLIYRRFFPIH